MPQTAAQAATMADLLDALATAFQDATGHARNAADKLEQLARERDLAAVHALPDPETSLRAATFNALAAGQGVAVHEGLEDASRETDPRHEELSNRLADAAAAAERRRDLDAGQKAALLRAAESDYQRGLKQIRADAQKQAENLVIAAHRGEAGALDEVRRLVTVDPGRFPPQVVRGLTPPPRPPTRPETDAVDADGPAPAPAPALDVDADAEGRDGSGSGTPATVADRTAAVESMLRALETQTRGQAQQLRDLTGRVAQIARHIAGARTTLPTALSRSPA